MYARYIRCIASPLVFPPADIRCTMASTGLPGISRISRKLKTSAAANATRNQRTLFNR